MATPSGCTWISGKGRTGSDRPATSKGTPVKIHFDPASSTPIALVADKVIPPIASAG
jgi:hypothetical protein